MGGQGYQSVNAKRPLRRWRGRFLGNSERLAAEAGVVTIPSTVEMTVDEDRAASKANDGSGADNADKVPVARDPVAAVVVSGYPDVSGARAGRRIGNRPTDDNPNPFGLGSGGGKAQSACNESCCQDPILHAFHTTSVQPADRWMPARLFTVGRLMSCCLHGAGYVECKHSVEKRLRGWERNKVAQLLWREWVRSGLLETVDVVRMAT